MEIEIACLNSECNILIQVFYMLICYILHIPEDSFPPVASKCTNPPCYMLQHDAGRGIDYVSFQEEPRPLWSPPSSPSTLDSLLSSTNIFQRASWHYPAFKPGLLIYSNYTLNLFEFMTGLILLVCNSCKH